MIDYIPIGLIGISHKTAPVEIRDRVALSTEAIHVALQECKQRFELDGLLILSTCNRTEVYFSSEAYTNLFKPLRHWFDDYKKVDFFSNEQLCYHKKGYDAVAHFFEVISGLDSQIIGEPQITGQVKEAYNDAFERKVTDTIINKMFSFGLQSEKAVRHDTFLSDGAVSVSFAGVELARKIFTNLQNKQILLIGAGETAELAALHFKEKGVQKIHVVNRTFEKARELAAQFNGRAYAFDQLPEALAQCDIVISATASQSHVLDAQTLEPICRKRRYQPIFLIDLAVPRDIDPRVESLDGVYLYNLDDLNEVVKHNMQRRQLEIPQAKKLIGETIGQFKKWMAGHSMGAVINRLRHHFDEIRLKELERLKKRLPNNGIAEIDYLTQSIVNKLMHQHIRLLQKSAANPEDYQEQVEFLTKLYELDGD